MKPNILLITTDQQRKDSLGCYGSAFVSTPHLDRLAREGVRFDRAYCTNPVCTPSRASLMSGRYVSRHGAWNIGTKVPEDIPMISHHLAEQGYRCHSVGKCHWQPYSSTDSAESLHNPDAYRGWNGPYYGFETLELALGHPGYDLTAGHYADWVREQTGGDDSLGLMTKPLEGSFGGEAMDRDLPVALHSSTWCGDRSMEFIRNRDPETPFFLNIGFPDPHHPHAVPRDYTRRACAEEMPPPAYRAGELDQKPFFFREAQAGTFEQSSLRGRFPMAGQHTGHDYTRVSSRDAALAKAYYYSMVHLIDDQIGRIHSCLREEGLLENTVIVFTSDHGELLGDHGLWLKGAFHYEEILNVPLLIWGPGTFSGGQQVDDVVSLVDLLPTLLELTGSPAQDCDGISLGGLLNETTSGLQRNGVLVEYMDDPDGLCLRSLITATHKLTVYDQQPFGELVDLTSEEKETRNLWDDPASADRKQEMISELEAMRMEPAPLAERLTYS